MKKRRKKTGFTTPKGYRLVKLFKSKQVNKKMAKKRRYFGKAKKTYRKAKSKSMKFLGIDLLDDIAYPGVYGYARQDIAVRAKPLIAQLPGADKFGNVADEVGMILINTLASRFIGGRVPLVRKLARQGIRIEAATIGAVMRQGSLGMGTAPTAPTQSFR